MRLTTIAAALVVAGCAGTQTADTTQAAKRACGGLSCFYEREVRDFEVVNHTTLIVYVGAQRCPYQVQLNSTFCDMEFAGELYFNSPSEPGQNTSPSTAMNAVSAATKGQTAARPAVAPEPPQRFAHLRQRHLDRRERRLVPANDPGQQPSKDRAWRAAQRLPNLERRIARQTTSSWSSTCAREWSRRRRRWARDKYRSARRARRHRAAERPAGHRKPIPRRARDPASRLNAVDRN